MGLSGHVGRHDAIVVGSGIGGLTCGALLATRGLRVLVLEQHAVVGGFCHSFVRGRRRYRFDAAVHDISGLGARRPVRHLLRTLGLEHAIDFLRMDHEYVLRDLRLRVPRDGREFERELSRRFPHEASSISQFFRDVGAVYRDVYRDVETTGGVPRPPRDVEAMLLYPGTHPDHMRWLGRSYQQILDGHFRDPHLKRLLSALTGYVGAPASAVDASLMAILFGGYYLDGGYYPRGGSQVLADALAGVIVARGGGVRTSTRVDRILVSRGRVSGVITARGEQFEAPVVVSNADLKHTFGDLVSPEHLDPAFLCRVNALRMSTTALAVFLGIDFAPDLAPLTFYVPEPTTEDAAGDSGILLATPSLVDPSLAPAGHHVLTLMTLVPQERARHLFDRPGYRKTAAYKAEKASAAAKLIAQVERILPGLSRHVVVSDAATALTVARYTLSSEGAIYGIERDRDPMDDQRPSFKTPIEGLYLAGASTFPGAGIEAVVISGVIAADDICPLSTPALRG